MATFRQAVPIIEGKLYEWGMSQKDEPGPVVSAPLDIIKTDNQTHKLSVQEQWMLRKYTKSMDAEIIERAMKSMSKEQKRLVEYRYIEGMKWAEVAAKMPLEYRTCYRLKDEILLILAYEFGYLSGEPKSDRKNEAEYKSRNPQEKAQ